MSRVIEFRRANPDVALLRASEPDEVRRYLVAQRLIDAAEAPLDVAAAGDGNMNCTLRVVTPRRRLIVKQARPWVEKYDDIPAPWNRSHVEAAYYASVAGIPGVGDRMPLVIHVDAVARVLVLEDLGTRGDLTSMYSGERVSDGECEMLADYLVRLHRIDVPADRHDLLANREMRALNHEHIFHFPLVEQNRLALDQTTPGLQSLADELKHDSVFVERVTALGVRYLEDGAALVHGDYFPGSWIRTGAGVAVIDPEFCFLGCGEYDMGVMMAHLTFAGATAAQMEIVERAIAADAGDAALAHQFAGVEIMRRLIGVAQLPFPAPVERKRELLARSRQLMLEG
jgi:5-methylthioribose kinase